MRLLISRPLVLGHATGEAYLMLQLSWSVIFIMLSNCKLKAYVILITLVVILTVNGILSHWIFETFAAGVSHFMTAHHQHGLEVISELSFILPAQWRQFTQPVRSTYITPRHLTVMRIRN